jgi:uncharacterized protein (DUF362 family)
MKARKPTQKRWLWYSVIFSLVLLVVLDLHSTVALNASKGYQLIYPLAQVQREAPWDETTVAVVRTNTPGMPNPVNPDTLGNRITTQQIEQMVRLAVDMTGGMEKVIDADDQLVLIKPNWVTAEKSGSGAITDNRVVRAVIKLVYEANPNVEIVVADGPGGWIDTYFASKYQNKAKVVDGLTINGYRQMVAELLNDASMPGLKLRLDDLNVPISNTVLNSIPGGGWYQDAYWTHKLVAEADKIISVPVMKIHGTRITVSIKNNIGIGAGSRYGWSKSGLDHDPAVIDKVIVDLATVAGIDYIVVDAITALEKAYQPNNGSPLYRNMIIAGHDTVAVDTVAARLMGFNPDDISHVTMAALTGLGINDLERINIVGESIEDAAYLFQKNIVHLDWLGRSKEGQSVRFWTCNLSGEPISPDTVPVAGVDGWTEPVYASDDFIDISKAFSNRAARYYYAFTHFDAPKNQKAELRVGSSTKMRVWIDGELVYDYKGYARKHVLPNDVVTIDLKEGKHNLLVETFKGTFNLTIAEPVPANIPNPRYPDRYAGTRVHGLEFFL